MNVDKNVAKDKCLKPTKCFWYHKKDSDCHVSPYAGCVRKNRSGLSPTPNQHGK